MADMNAIVALQKAERLVATIARAFYTDITVLVVDTLIREKYIKDKDEDLGSRLNLQPKQVRSALAELLAEGFAAKEMMSDEIYSGRSSNYWYIDLRHAVNVILLRVFQMKEILSQRQEAKAAHQALPTYVCPRCHEKFEVMDIYKLSNGDRSFCCSHCCPNDDHSGCKKGSGYTLEDFNDKKGLDSVTALIGQLNEQLGESTDPAVPRESIFELVHSLRDTVVPSNLPSQLRQRGMGGQQRGDVSSAHARFQDDFHHRGRAADKAAAERGAAGGRASSRPVQVLYTKNWRGEEVVVEIEQSEDEDDGDEDWDAEGGEEEDGNGAGAGGGLLLPSRAALKRKAADAAAKEEEAAKRAKKALPTFLKGSAISGNYNNTADSEDDDSESSKDDAKAEAAAAAQHHARRLGVAAVTSVAERDEMKKRLRPWTERMKQVWRRQQSEMRREEQEAAAAAAGVNGDDAWWESDDEDGPAKNGGGGRKGAPQARTSARLLGLSAGVGAGQRFRVGVRFVPIEALTEEDIAKMSAEDYTRFYNVVVGEGGC
ncbi:unnamed protein product [Ectocarpus sp. CCAP 1310/34]|nr:unnamed protein product [Ectocarpus sp. CCAP 1310/34]